MSIVADASRRLTEQGIRHVVGGSFASSAWGEMRTTNDEEALSQRTGEPDPFA